MPMDFIFHSHERVNRPISTVKFLQSPMKWRGTRSRLRRQSACIRSFHIVGMVLGILLPLYFLPALHGSDRSVKVRAEILATSEISSLEGAAFIDGVPLTSVRTLHMKPGESVKVKMSMRTFMENVWFGTDSRTWHPNFNTPENLVKLEDENGYITRVEPDGTTSYYCVVREQIPTPLGVGPNFGVGLTPEGCGMYMAWTLETPYDPMAFRFPYSYWGSLPYEWVLNSLTAPFMLWDVKLVDSSSDGRGDSCSECGGGGGDGESFPDSNFSETMPVPTNGNPGTLSFSAPLASSAAPGASSFSFSPAAGETYSDTTSGNLRTITTDHSRIELESIPEGVILREYAGAAAGTPPIKTTSYLRITDSEFPTPGLRVVTETSTGTSTRDFFESISADRMATSWKTVIDGVEVTTGIGSISTTNGTRTSDITYGRLLPGGQLIQTDRHFQRFVNQPWGEDLVEESRGLGVEQVTTTYVYHTGTSPLPLRGRLHYWSDTTGDWERYLHHPGTGRLTHTLRPWLDTPASPTNATESNSFAIVHGDDGSFETSILGALIDAAEYGDPPRPDPIVEKGDWDETTKSFALNPSGKATRTSRQNESTLVDNRTTRSVTISDDTGTRRSDTEVFTGGTAYALLTRTDYTYDTQGRLTQVHRDGDLVSSTVYHANGTRTVTAEDGSSATYSAGIPGSENSTQTSHGGGLFPDLASSSTTTYQTTGTTYTQSRSAGGLSVSSSSTSTHGGRLLSTIDELGRTTNYSYTIDFNAQTNTGTGQRTETESGPGGVTRVTTYHRDGQLKSVTGSGVVPEFYEYSVSGGLLVTTVRLGAADSPRLRKTFTDGNGRVIREESPLPGGRTLTSTHHYDGYGRLVRVQRTGLADERTEYDSSGRPFRRGLDIDGNGSLQPASTDRMVETESFYENNGSWWEVSVTSTYLTNGNGTKTELSRTRRRLGLGAESRTIVSRADGTVIDTSSTVDRATATVTVTADANFSNLNAVSVYRYGRLVSQSSFTVATPTEYRYDALGRVRFIKDPRTGLETEIGLNAAGQQLSITRPDPDGAGPLGPLVTEYGYYPATHPNAGELHWSEDGLGKITYRAYNTRGQLTHQWGAGTYPLRHLYNTYGDMTGLHTWRAGDPATWSGIDLPAAFNASAPDITTWVYDEGSGLLVQKKDHSGRGPTYLYHDSGLLQRRTWARGLFAEYGWNNAGELATVSYSDDTPDVTRTYRRDGSLATVTDAAGTTTYAYNGTLASGESIEGGALDGLTLSYPQSQGRRQSFTATLGGDTVSSMGYSYDTYGRLESVTEPGIGTNGFAAVFGYVANSDLPHTTTSKAGDVNGTPLLTGTRGYDNADRLTSIGYARPGNTVVTSHGYLLDAADRRTRADREDGTAWSYGYNDRDEVTSAVKLLPGEELLAGWQQTFDYDNLGNRKTTHEGGDSSGANRRQTVYAANALNQYTQISHPNAFDVLGRAPSDVSVTVNEQPVTRQGEFWRREVGDLPNALAAVWQPVQVDAVDPGAGPNGADVPARRSGHRFVPMASETPFHDFDGNLVSDARWTYGWNGENQLIEMTTAAPALAAGVPRERYRFVYDSRSRRIARTVESWNLDAGAWVLEKNERFIHDDWNVVAVVDGAGEVVQRYAWGNDLSSTPQGAGGVGGLLAAADAASGRNWCYAYDGNGNVSAVVDLADGAKVGRYDYDAFGRTIATRGDEGLAGVNPYRFSTKPLEGTGVYYYGFRYHLPETGRWLSRDPIGEEGGANLCGFIGNQPTARVDYLGLAGGVFYPSPGYNVGPWPSNPASPPPPPDLFPADPTVPNTGGYGDIHNNSHKRTICYLGERTKIRKEIFDKLADFSLFNGNSTNQTAYLHKSTGVVTFDPPPLVQTGMRLGSAYDTITVITTNNPTKHEVYARTTGSHFLVGKRTWGISNRENDPLRGTLYTHAREQFASRWFHFMDLIASIKKQNFERQVEIIWTDYLNNVTDHFIKQGKITIENEIEFKQW